MLIPYRIDVTSTRPPVANWLVLGVTVVCFFGIDIVTLQSVTDLGTGDERLAPTFHPMVAQGWGWGLLGHVLLHADFLHLLGNAIFLWVFGNAVCSAMHPLLFLASYFGLGLVAGGVDTLLVGRPAVGASGAINGIVGMCLVWYPREYVSCLLFVGTRPRAYELPAWLLILFWFAFDILGAVLGTGGIGYVAHIAGLLAGVGLAVGLLKTGLVTMPDAQATLLDLNWRQTHALPRRSHLLAGASKSARARRTR
jgi:membrane associated rhomboid family serine protease